MVLILDGSGAQVGLLGLVVYSSGAQVGLVLDGTGAQVGLVCARLGVREFPRPALICHGWEGRHATSAYQPKLLGGNTQPKPREATTNYSRVTYNQYQEKKPANISFSLVIGGRCKQTID